ncbi:unnamed protein product [Caenorhabditis angaria]|uniref:Cyclin N-terminal domain-containing protein n=1 Tax=Caenorhabditis angaria TaxID=860376 RepID=A0A9P1I312_9PELO|nr:unnamed protein product [Caenorhabditis angaria]
MHIFLTKGLTKEKKILRDVSSPTLKNNESVLSIGTTSTSIHQEVNDDHKIHRDTPQKKQSIFRRLAKIVSSDDVIHTMTSSSNRAPILEEKVSREEIFELIEVPPDSPTLQSNQFSFLKRLKSTITHVDRWYVCSEQTDLPMAIFSYIPFGSEYGDPLSSSFGNNMFRGKFKRSKSIFGSADRIRHHQSFEELRPYIFREAEDYISLIINRKKRNPSPFFTLYDKPRSARDRKESFRGELSEDIYPGSIDIPQSIFNRDSCSEKGASLEEKYEDIMNRIEENDEDEYYDPKAFDDLAKGKRTVIRLNFFIASTIHLTPSERTKTAINEDFASKYPYIHLTLSKLKSIKREMLQLAKLHFVDYHTLAIAYVYFEKIITQGLISKDNRKCVAGASLLVAMKLNDYSKTTILEYIENAENQLRESRSDILSYELPLCSALKFKLNPPLEELESHLDKLKFEYY